MSEDDFELNEMAESRAIVSAAIFYVGRRWNEIKIVFKTFSCKSSGANSLGGPYSKLFH